MKVNGTNSAAFAFSGGGSGITIKNNNIHLTDKDGADGNTGNVVMKLDDKKYSFKLDNADNDASTGNAITLESIVHMNGDAKSEGFIESRPEQNVKNNVSDQGLVCSISPIKECDDKESTVIFSLHKSKDNPGYLTEGYYCPCKLTTSS